MPLFFFMFEKHISLFARLSTYCSISLPPSPLLSCIGTPCCPHPDQTMSSPVWTTGVPCHWKQGTFIFSLPSSSCWPWWLSPKDALSLPEGVVILHSPLWWTMQLDWGSSFCVQRESVCVCCHCTVCWNNSCIRMSLRMKRTNLSGFTSRSSLGAFLLLKWLQ